MEVYDRRASTLTEKGLPRELSPGPLAAEARIMPLDQAAIEKRGGNESYGPECFPAIPLCQSSEKLLCDYAIALTSSTFFHIRCSIVVSNSACHAEDPGSIPGGGVAA